MYLILIFLLRLWFGWALPTVQLSGAGPPGGAGGRTAEAEATALGWTVYGA